jgi:hypothetical protein
MKSANQILKVMGSVCALATGFWLQSAISARACTLIPAFTWGESEVTELCSSLDFNGIRNFGAERYHLYLLPQHIPYAVNKFVIDIPDNFLRFGGEIDPEKIEVRLCERSESSIADILRRRCGKYEMVDLYNPAAVDRDPLSQAAPDPIPLPEARDTPSETITADVQPEQRIEFRNGQLVVVNTAEAAASSAANPEVSEVTSSDSVASSAPASESTAATEFQTPQGPIVVDEEAGVIIIETNQPIPAESMVDIVLSGVRNPRSPNLYRFNATLNYPAFGPRTIGFWLVEIRERDNY